MHFLFFSFFDLTEHTLFDNMYLTFSFPRLPQFNWILLLMNLHFYSSFSTWMIFHGISCPLCLLMNHYSSHNLMKIPTLSSLSFLLKFFLFSFLAGWPFFFHNVWCSLKVLFLLDGFSSFLAWWSELSLFFDESFFFDLVTLSSLRTLSSGVESIRLTLAQFEIKVCISNF